MSKTTRTNIVSKEEQNKPGPGVYNNKHKTIGTDSQKVTFRGRPKDLS